jgi:hypothetical protein
VAELNRNLQARVTRNLVIVDNAGYEDTTYLPLFQQRVTIQAVPDLTIKPETNISILKKEVLYNILTEFEVSMKLLRLIKM